MSRSETGNRSGREAAQSIGIGLGSPSIEDGQQNVSLVVFLLDRRNLGEITPYLGGKKVVKPRPQQSNQNRIVAASGPRLREDEGEKRPRCVLHSSDIHKLRNDSPKGNPGEPVHDAEA